MRAIYCPAAIWLLVSLCMVPAARAQEGQAAVADQETAPEEGTKRTKDQANAEKTNANGEDEPAAEDAVSSGDDGSAIKARFQLTVKSVKALGDAIERSSLGPLTQHFAGVVSEDISMSSEWIEQEQLTAVVDLVSGWPDTKAELAIFAPDVQGRVRWGLRVALPVGQVHDLARDFLEHEQLAEFFEGAEINLEDDRFAVMVNDQSLVLLEAEGAATTVISSHPDLRLPTEFFTGAKDQQEALVAARLTFANTEKDSGETFFSKLKLIKSLDYTLHAQDEGNWLGELRIGWPPVLGLATKPFVGRTKQTFFVPADAFGGAVMKITSASAALDKLVGFDEDDGLLADHAGDELCVTILPGQGFFPVPDVVLQCRASDVEDLIESTKEQVAKANKKSKERDDHPRWHSTKIRDLEVFWSDQSLQGQTLIPFTLRPVFFVHNAKDGKDRDRNFLVIGFTSTDPEEFVERWLDLPRGDEPRYLPSRSSLNGEAWVHWKQVYDWVVPYVNLGLGGGSSDFVIRDDVADGLSDSQMTVKLNYEGLRVTHVGPIPLGMLTLPAMISASMQEATGSDLARERIAARRLKVLYHHSQLFHKDLGRWPVEVAELDGYIDFAGNSHLLKLRGSPKKRMAKFFEDLFDGDDEEDEDDEEELDDLYAEIDDSLYVVAWERDQWTLGFEEDKFDHLEQMYIDQEGVIHRVKKAAETKTQKAGSTGDDAQGEADESEVEEAESEEDNGDDPADTDESADDSDDE